MRCLIGGGRLGEVALASEHVTNLVMRDGKVALPSGISGVGLGEAFLDGERPSIPIERPRKFALSLKYFCDLSLRDAEVVLPSGISRVGLGEAFSDGQRGLVGGERLGKVALGADHIADPTVRDGQVALPFGVSGVGLTQAFEDRIRGPVGGERLSEVALRSEHVAILEYVRWKGRAAMQHSRGLLWRSALRSRRPLHRACELREGCLAPLRHRPGPGWPSTTRRDYCSPWPFGLLARTTSWPHRCARYPARHGRTRPTCWGRRGRGG